MKPHCEEAHRCRQVALAEPDVALRLLGALQLDLHYGQPLHWHLQALCQLGQECVLCSQTSTLLAAVSESSKQCHVQGPP
jgi:hypothetical protein